MDTEAIGAHPGRTESGWSAMTSFAGAADPSGRESPLLLLGEGTTEFAHALLAHVVLRGGRALVLDAGEGFDPGRLARVTQERQRTIPTLLTAVRVARAGTCESWLDLLERDAEAEARRGGCGWIFVLGCLDLLVAPGVESAAAKRLAGRVATALHRLAQAGLGIVAAQNRNVLRAAGRSDLLGPLMIRRGLRLLEVAPAPSSGERDSSSDAPVASSNSQLSFAFAGRSVQGTG